MDRPREDEGGTKCSREAEPAAKVAEKRASMKRRVGSRWPKVPILDDPNEPVKHSWTRRLK